jgi:hypothetical protein
MDDKGFIFTVDAALALVVVIVLSASIVTYTLLPIYQGEDHQHLEALADSALETMDQDGTLRVAAAEYANGSTTEAENNLRSSLDQLIPDGIGYKIYVGHNNTPVMSNDSSRYPSTSNDVVTKIRVIALPKEGWMGRAYYKLDMVNFTTYNMNTTTTVWNFHNWLTNFQPWNNGLDSCKYWGGTSSSSSQKSSPITFYVPTTTGQINNAKILIGSAFSSRQNNPSAFSTDFYLNGALSQSIKNTKFQYLYTGANDYMYNYQGNLTGNLLNSGSNNFYLRLNASQYSDLPWFSILANYTTSINAPVGIIFPPAIYFNDIAGVGRPYPDSVTQYDLDTGQITNKTGRTVTWAQLQDPNYDLDTSSPFELTGLPNTDDGSAVASIENVTIPHGYKVLDAYTVVNAYGGVDGAIVQVKNPSGGWRNVFTSFGSFTRRTDGGYGNLPGIISLHDTDMYKAGNDYLQPGTNQVRIIIWDNVPGSDYDLVGLKSSYTQVAYTSLPIQWDTFTFNSYQNHDNSQSQSLTESRDFHIGYGALNTMLFLGTGLDTRSITVKCNNSTASETLYSGNVPYTLNLSSYDSNNIFTTVTANGTVPKPGNYTLTITITPAKAYESGDLASNTGSWSYLADPEIYSGTRISIFYPQFLENMWAANFNTTAEAAKKNASDALVAEINNLSDAGFTVNESLIRTEALWAGDLPESTPIRLELWKQ